MSKRSKSNRGFVTYQIADCFPLNADAAFDPFVQPAAPPLPWHYRSVAEWWPEFGNDEAESAAFIDFVRATGGPGLEVGCGSGRRLLDCWRAGLDVDGSESPGALIRLCRERAAGAGVGLFAQPFHELDLPRRYRCIYAGRVLGAGGHAELDAAGLRRLFRLLEPGGVLLLEHPAPWRTERSKWLWQRSSRRALDPPDLPAFELHAPSGGVLRLSSQPFAFSRERRCLTYTVRAQRLEQSEPLASRSFALCQRFPARNDVLEMLTEAGFERKRIEQGYADERGLCQWIAEKSKPSKGKPRPGPLGPIGQAGALMFRM